VARNSGDADITVQSGTNLTFNSATWNTYQPVTLEATPDGYLGNACAVIRCSAAGLTNKDAVATKLDTDAPNLARMGSTITGNNGANWNLLIDGNSTVYDGSTGFGSTYWRNAVKAPGSMVLDLKSVCTVYGMRLLLWDKDGRYYRYKIEGSADGTNWVMVADRTTGEHRSWQDVVIDPSVQVRYLRLTGTYGSANDKFHVVEWEVYGVAVGGGGGCSGEEDVLPYTWSSGVLSTNYSANNLVDGDTNTLWVGNACGAPWRITIDLGQAVVISNFDILFEGDAWTNIAVAGSADSETWFDVLTATDWPISIQYLYLNLWTDPSRTSPPAIREIRWNVR
jgi:hypothetical protein